MIHKPNLHTPVGKLSEDIRNNSIICTAPSKTFNLAGVQVSSLIVPNERLRQELAKKLWSVGVMPSVFALAAHTAAYNEGEEWLEQLLEYLKGNLDFMESFIKRICQRLSSEDLRGHIWRGWISANMGFRQSCLRR